MRFSTKAIHVGQDPEAETGSVTVPVFLASTYRQSEPGKEGKYVYSRTANPTRTALEECLASLEEGKYGLAFSSGMAEQPPYLCSCARVTMLLREMTSTGARIGSSKRSSAITACSSRTLTLKTRVTSKRRSARILDSSG